MSEQLPVPENESEKLPEISPEEFREMLDQVPALKEMLQERKSELELLEASPSADNNRIETLKTEIEELEFEIQGREEAGM
jgi:septal ring factor EnvC (AmiA/AmiB activator)